MVSLEKEMAILCILAFKISIVRGAWQAIVQGCKELAMTEQLSQYSSNYISVKLIYTCLKRIY